jgi:hypothetical protein
MLNDLKAHDPVESERSRRIGKVTAGRNAQVEQIVTSEGFDSDHVRAPSPKLQSHGATAGAVVHDTQADKAATTQGLEQRDDETAGNCHICGAGLPDIDGGRFPTLAIQPRKAVGIWERIAIDDATLLAA